MYMKSNKTLLRNFQVDLHIKIKLPLNINVPFFIKVYCLKFCYFFVSVMSSVLLFFGFVMSSVLLSLQFYYVFDSVIS